MTPVEVLFDKKTDLHQCSLYLSIASKVIPVSLYVIPYVAIVLKV
jgi:hypothetical protein